LLHEASARSATSAARLWSRPATATLPDTLPLSVRLFVLWLAVLVWKRDDDAAAATG
jgi:hypothetical protein